ncbi:hypothetical protein [Micromonospora zhanjiangensis]|uniref:ATP synthase protein I n=1 Tax=Micromonospora zhanjiangensis TaxID=1522057 RepID=A0ABV8KSX7_9ACTN
MTAPDDRRWRVAHLPALVVVSVVAIGLAAAVGWWLAGGTGAAGAAAGVAVVTVSYVLSTLVVAWADSVHPRLVLPFGLGVYAAKIALLGTLMIAVATSGWAGLLPFSYGIAAGVVAWTGAHIWWISTVHAARVRSGEIRATDRADD